jgi:hypothetical protein
MTTTTRIRGSGGITVVLALLLCVVFVLFAAVASAGAAEGAAARPVDDALFTSARGRYLQRLAEDMKPVAVVGRLPDGTTARCPMTGSRITANITDRFAVITFEHTFRHDEANVAVEADYIFPLMPDMAVTALKARTPRGEFAAKVIEKNAARKEYAEAVARGDGAYLAEYDENQPDVARLRVGNLLPGEEVVVVTTAVVLLQHTVGWWQLEVPLAYIVPYDNSKPANAAPRAALFSHPQAHRVPYQWRFDASIVSTGAPLADVESVTYPASIVQQAATTASVTLPMAYPQPGVDDLGADVRPPLASPQPDRMIVLRFRTIEDHPAAVAQVTELQGGARGVHLSFVPEELVEEVAGDVAGSELEYVFIIDRSGSMDGPSIAVARNALASALRLLPRDALFNVVSFGSTFQRLFPAAQEATERNVATAVAAVHRFEADMGGTEIEAPLRDIFAETRERFRNIFLITDGQVSNEVAVIDIIRRNEANNRVFTFGIGNGVSPFIVVEGARAGKAAHYFLSDNTAGYLAEAMADSMQRAMKPSLVVTHVAVTWASGRAAADGLVVARSDGDVMFAGSAGSVLAIAEGRTAAMLCGGADGGGGEAAFIEVHLQSYPRGATRRTRGSLASACEAAAPAELLKLAAKHVLLELESTVRYDASVRPRIVELSTRYQVLSSETSLLAVEARSEQVKQEVRQQKQVQVPASYARRSGSASAIGGLMLTFVLSFCCVLLFVVL